MIRVRRAQDKDIKRVTELLAQVLELHADLRPDLFIHGTVKYTENQLSDIFADEKTPVFVAVDDSDTVQGYAFCILKEPAFATNMTDIKTLYIDDLCVDSNARGRHIGTTLFDYVMDFAKQTGCYTVTLNVWEGNDSARHFYEKMGMFVRETQMERRCGGSPLPIRRAAVSRLKLAVLIVSDMHNLRYRRVLCGTPYLRQCRFIFYMKH